MKTHTATLMGTPHRFRVSSNEINARVTVEVIADDIDEPKLVYSVAVHMNEQEWTKKGLSMRVKDAVDRARRVLGGKVV